MKSRFDAVLKPARNDADNIISLREAVALTNVSRPVLIKLIQSGELPGAMFGKAWKVPKKEFLNAFQKRLMGAYGKQNEE